MFQTTNQLMVTVTIITDSNDNYGTPNGFKETLTDDGAKKLQLLSSFQLLMVNGKYMKLP
jgi:hypothetical protein